MIYSAFSSFTCEGPDTKNRLLPINQATTTILVQVPIYTNSAVVHGNSSFIELYITSHLQGVRASIAAWMHELWLALLRYLCQDTGEGEILIPQFIQTVAKGACKDASLPDSK